MISYRFIDKVLRHKQKPRIMLVVVACTIILIGLINLYSATQIHGHSFFLSQIKYQIISFLLVGIFCYFLNLNHLKNYAYVFGIIGIFLLIYVLLMGNSHGGSTRWISLSLVNLKFQPSELCKILMAIFCARYLYDRRHLPCQDFYSLLVLMIVLCIYFLLIYMQPDLGTAGIIVFICLFQLAFVKIQQKTIIKGLLLSVLVCIIGWFFVIHDYQKKRILTLFYPEHDPTGSSYNYLQSLVSVGSGGYFGKGYLEGTQSLFRFLPARHTDFVFSVFAEEHGFFLSILLLLLFIYFLYIILTIAKKASNSFYSLLAIGLCGYFLFQISINTAMVLGLFPVVGIPLPFFSYGGSSALISTLACGILYKIDYNT